MKATFSRDPHSALEPIQDPIHGPINLGAGLHTPSDLIRRLLKTEMLTRLRHVRQLGFASIGFPAADHMRFSHALGSMQMMRGLLEKVLDEEHFAEAAGAVRSHFPDFKKLGNWGRSERFEDRLYNHMLVAALLEDVGELPFAKATELGFLPHPADRVVVETATRCRTGSWGSKEFFTMALINRAIQADKDLAQDLNIELLALLITKNMPGGGAIPPALKRLCHLVDGVVDADRLDYVFRDAYHTGGTYGSPSAVIQSLLFYDDIGPVFSDPEPVGGFLTAYANLWSTVYFSPQNRFRVVVLATLLQQIRRNPELAETTKLATVLNEGMRVHEFLQFDDRWLFERIGSLRDSQSGRKLVRVDATLKILLDEEDRPDYDALWVVPGTKSGAAPSPDELFHGQFFFDTFFNAHEHTLYSAEKPIRIRSALYSADNSELSLERCEGPFARLLDVKWTFTKRKDGTLVFFPADHSRKNLATINKVTTLRAFDTAMCNTDPLQRAYPSDARREEFHPPALFISYATIDAPFLDRICEQLFHRQQRYQYLPSDDCTASAPTRTASIKMARAAEAALVLLSETYLAHYQNGARTHDGNIWEEVKVLVERAKHERLQIRFLSVDDYTDLKPRLGTFPLAQLTGQNRKRFTPTKIPSLGKSVRNATAAEIAKMVSMILEGLHSA
jgi:HD superfamily phosphohydrolase